LLLLGVVFLQGDESFVERKRNKALSWILVEYRELVGLAAIERGAMPGPGTSY
jgi:hypothetical protein